MSLDLFDCPDKHSEIVKQLVNGRMITSDEKLFDILKQYIEYYRGFFEQSFGYELVHKPEVIYVTSDATNEKFSRSFMLLLAVVTYEFSRQGKNLYEEFEKKHTIDEFKELVKNSSYKDSCRTVNIEEILKTSCQKRNILKMEDDSQTFRFTSAVNIFLEEAKVIAEIDIRDFDGEE